MSKIWREDAFMDRMRAYWWAWIGATEKQREVEEFSLDVEHAWETRP